MTEQSSRHNTTFTTDGREAYGYLALPPSGQGPGVIVIQEWWGLDDHIADLTERLAGEGFVAFAPDLYGGRVAHESDDALRMMQELPVEEGVRRLSGAVDYLLAHPAVTSDKVGAIGFCMGGGFVLLLAAREGDRIAAAVPFYGVIQGELPDFSGLRAAVQGHYGQDDPTVPVESLAPLAEAIEKGSGRAPEFHLYPAGHAFLNDQRPTYHPASAEPAWQRAVAFLHRHLDPAA
jgi:carboxymethylenebutenolidase